MKIVPIIASFIADSTFFASCKIGRHSQGDYDEK
jgi:hypothetical protein